MTIARPAILRSTQGLLALAPPDSSFAPSLTLCICSLSNEFHGLHTERFFDLLNCGEVWQRLATHDALLPVAQALLGSDCILNTYGTSIVGPGETAQLMHVDDGIYIGGPRQAIMRDRPHLAGGGRQSIVLNTMIALCDVSSTQSPPQLKIPQGRL